MSGAGPTREQADLAEVLELVLDRGIVINADVAVTVGDTELLGIELRAAIASFETAAEYGLAFPSGTDMRRVERASGRDPLDEGDAVDLGIEASSGGESTTASGPPDGGTPEGPGAGDRPGGGPPGGGGETESEAEGGEPNDADAEADAEGEDA